MKRRTSEDESEQAQKIAPAQAQEEVEPEEEFFPELVERIEDLSPALNAAVTAGDANQVRGIIQQYDDHVTEIYSEHKYYDFTPAIQSRLEVLGERAHLLGFHEICSIFYYEECDGAVEEIGVAAGHAAAEY